eukprot:3705842-Rhodomonas_salina.3
MALTSCKKLNKELRHQLQRAVSQYRRRFVDRDMQLDLDLTYIADRVLAMSIPCVDSAPYRFSLAPLRRAQAVPSDAVAALCFSTALVSCS